MRRPRAVTLLALLVLCTTAWNFIRFGSALAEWEVLASYTKSAGPVYIALSGLFWGLAGLPVYPGLVLGLPWARKTTGAAVGLYLLYYWVDRLLLSAAPRAGAPFALAASLLAAGLTLFALLGPGSQDHFTERDTHERKP